MSILSRFDGLDTNFRMLISNDLIHEILNFKVFFTICRKNTPMYNICFDFVGVYMKKENLEKNLYIYI